MLYRFLTCMLLLFVALPCVAADELAPADPVVLKPGEGLVYLVVDRLSGVSTFRLTGKGSGLPNYTYRFSTRLTDAEAYRVLALPAGHYELTSVNYSRIQSGDEGVGDEGFVINVEAGKVNYAGRFSFLPNGFSVSILRANRASADLAELIKRFPRIDIQAIPMVNAVAESDPFAEVLDRAPLLARSDRSLEPDPVPGMPLGKEAIDPYFLPSQSFTPQISPDGTMVLYYYSSGGFTGLRLYLVNEHKHMDLLPPSEYSVADVRWIAPSLAYVQTRTGGRNLLSLLRIKSEAGKVSVDVEVMERAITIVGMRGTGTDTRMIVSCYRNSIKLFEVDPFQPVDSQLGKNKPLPDGGEDVTDWLLDGNGKVRIVARARHSGSDKSDHYSFFDEATARWQDFSVKLGFEDVFSPVGVASDGKGVLALSNLGSEQVDLVDYDPVTSKVRNVLFTRSGVDLQYVRRDLVTGAVIGVAFVENGFGVTEYFDEVSRTLQQRISRAFPEQSVRIASRSQNGGVVLLQVFGPSNPSKYFVFDVLSAGAEQFLVARPWLEDDKLAPMQSFKVKAEDGSEIDAFLTMAPVAEGTRRPLVVLPHGGPYGIFDARIYDGDVQFLASLGYAVLQVNFRGSGARGRHFLQAGLHGFGTVIESDIEAATKFALTKFPLDASKIACMGASYGGYSALMLSIRNPGLCKAVVTLAGVSDLPLLYSQYEVGASQLKILNEYIGDPATELDKMVALSPDYMADKISAPVFIAHGSDDMVVSPEHAARLAFRLGELHKPFYYQVVSGEGHGFDKVASYERIYGQIALFLDQSLNGGKPVEAGHSVPITIPIPLDTNAVSDPDSKQH